jgi:PPOX class probable F420-dependent enzyme
MANRSQITMSAAEITKFLDEARTINIATVSPGGSIHLVAMWFVVIDGNPVMWAYRKSQKVGNLSRDPRMSGLVEAGYEYASLRGVELIGRADLVSDHAEVTRIGERLNHKYADAAPGSDVARAAEKRVGIVLRADRIISWDHQKMVLKAELP